MTQGLGLTYTYTTELTSTYDQYGRVLTSTDADNRKTTTAYTPTTERSRRLWRSPIPPLC